MNMGKKSKRFLFNKSFDEQSEDSEKNFVPENSSYDEGECENSSNNEEFDDGYDEDLMGDDKDREMLRAMTEVEREKELFKRMERREALKARFIIQNRLKASQKKSEDYDSNKRTVSNERPKRVLHKASHNSINIIRNKRLKRKMSSNDHPNGDSSEIVINDKNFSKILNKKYEGGDEDYSSTSYNRETSRSKQALKDKYCWGDFDEDSDNEFQDTFQKKSLSPISTLEQFNKLRISRHKLTLWIHQPFFETKIPGFLVRFANVLPANPDDTTSTTPQHCYQVFEIIEILKSSKPYKFGEYFTNKVLRLNRGDEERIVRMEFISNQQFTESEFQSYMESLSLANKPKPTLETVEKKTNDLNYCINFRPTEQDIDHVVEQKNKFRKIPVNFTAEKHKTLFKIEEAKQKGDINLVKKLEDDLDRLDRQLELIHQQRTKNLDKIRIINERNRRANAAQLDRVLESGSQSRDSQHDDANNPFVRRRTNPIIMLDKKLHGHYSSKLKQDFSPKNYSSDTPTSQHKPSSAPSNSTADVSLAAIGVKNNQKAGSVAQLYDISKDMAELYNFELDISLDVPTNDNSSTKR